MVGNVTSASATSVLRSTTAAPPQPVAAPRTAAQTKKAVPSVAQINATALAQRQKIAESLYDRSMTLDEGVSAFKRQQSIAAYAKTAQPMALRTPRSRRSRPSR